MYRIHWPLVDRFTMVRLVIVSLLVSTGALAAPAPWDDPRLTPVKAQLDEAFTAAGRDGVPASILADKIQEGLAKNIPPPRLAQAVRALETSLAEAVTISHQSSPPLLKAIVAARAVGAQAREIEQLLTAARPRGTQATTRALDVVTDLAQRGFPPGATVQAVAIVIAKNPRAVDQMASAAQSLSARVGRAEALEAIARGAEKGLGPTDVLNNEERGPNRENSGQRGPGYQHGKGKP